MLRALKMQLSLLAEHSDNTLNVEIKKRVGSKEAAALTISLRNFILVMPEMIAQIRAWAEDDTIPSKTRRLHGFVMTYLYHPIDFIPDETNGLFGYLDDAYVVGHVYYSTMQEIGKDQLRFLPNKSDIANQIAEWLVQVRKVISPIASEIDRMVRDLSDGRDDSFNRLLQRDDLDKSNPMNGRR